MNPGLRKRKKLQTEKIGKARKGPLGGSGTKETEKQKTPPPIPYSFLLNKVHFRPMLGLEEPGALCGASRRGGSGGLAAFKKRPA